MWLPALGLLIGILIGLFLSLQIPAEYARYTAIAVLAALDSILGAARAELDDQYDNTVFISGLAGNMVLAAFLVFLGDRLGVDLSIAAIVAFGLRIFENLAKLRRHLLRRGRGAHPTP